MSDHLTRGTPHYEKKLDNSDVMLTSCWPAFRYIDKSAKKLQQRLLQNNVELYRGVLPWLEEKRIPFVFTSSYLEATAASLLSPLFFCKLSPKIP